jgi:hypothetical protein
VHGPLLGKSEMNARQAKGSYAARQPVQAHAADWRQHSRALLKGPRGRGGSSCMGRSSPQRRRYASTWRRAAVRQQPGVRRPGVLQAARAQLSTSPHGRRQVRWHAASKGKSRWITRRARGRERAAASCRGGRHAGGSSRAAQARKAVEAKQADAQAASSHRGPGPSADRQQRASKQQLQGCARQPTSNRVD